MRQRAICIFADSVEIVATIFFVVVVAVVASFKNKGGGETLRRAAASARSYYSTKYRFSVSSCSRRSRRRSPRGGCYLIFDEYTEASGP